MTTPTSTEPTMTRHLHTVLDEGTYQRLRKAAFDGQTSIGEIVRAALLSYLGGGRERVQRPPEGGDSR